MPLDGVSIKCLAAELRLCLAGARVDRVFQPDRFDVLLLLHGDRVRHRLLLSANPAAPRIHLTASALENPAEAPMFCMLLRKHLAGARLVDVTAPDCERIIRLHFTAINEMGDAVSKFLVLEMMGRHSNLILLNHEDRIYDAIIHVDASINRVREVLPARPYVPPPDQKKLTPSAVLALPEPDPVLFPDDSSRLPVSQALLMRLQGFSPQLCQEVAWRAGLDPQMRRIDLDASQAIRLCETLFALLKQISDGCFTPCLYFDAACEPASEPVPLDFHALELHAYPVRKAVASLSEAMEAFYLEKVRQNTLNQIRQFLRRQIDNQLEHAVKKKGIHDQDAREGSEFARYRLMGDLILANLQQVKPEQTALLATDYNQDDSPSVMVPLLPHLSPSQNAQRYYRLYSKAKVKFQHASQLAAADVAEIAYLESLQAALDAAGNLDDLDAIRQEIQIAGFSSRKANAAVDERSNLQNASAPRSSRRLPAKKPPKSAKSGERDLPFRRYVSSDGLVILAGRNNLQNDQLTLKTAQKGDIWLHAQKLPGTHVIIQAKRQVVPEQTLLEAAEIAAWFSRAVQGQQSAGGTKTAVDYCPASHVRKPAAARPGMVIYDRYQTLLVTPRAPRVREESSL